MTIFRAQASNVSFPDPWYKPHYDQLTAGITEMDYDIPGHPNSILAIFGDFAFPVATNAVDEVVIAAAGYNQVGGGFSAFNSTSHPMILFVIQVAFKSRAKASFAELH